MDYSVKVTLEELLQMKIMVANMEDRRFTNGKRLDTIQLKDSIRRLKDNVISEIPGNMKSFAVGVVPPSKGPNACPDYDYWEDRWEVVHAIDPEHAIFEFRWRMTSWLRNDEIKHIRSIEHSNRYALRLFYDPSCPRYGRFDHIPR